MVPSPDFPPKPANDIDTLYVDDSEAVAHVSQSLERQASQIRALASTISVDFPSLIGELKNLKGTVYVIADSGSEGFAELAADELNATGTPSLALEPNRQPRLLAQVVTRKDAVLLISRHTSHEGIAHLLPGLQNSGALLVGMLSNPSAALVRRLKYTIPATETTRDEDGANCGTTLQSFAAPLQVLCDALRNGEGLVSHGIARPNPLTSRLLLKAADLMHSEAELPQVLPQSSLFEAMARLHKHQLGAVIVADADDKFVSVLSERDAQAALLHSTTLQTPVAEVSKGKNAQVHVLSPVSDALDLMRRGGRDAVAVLDDSQRVLGLLTLRDLLT